MDKKFDQFVQKNRLVTDAVLFILSSVSGYFTYQGALLVLDQASVINGFSVSAFAFATGVTAALFLFWRYAISIVPKMKTGYTRWLGFGIVLLGGVFIVALSSWMNVMALAGAGALEAHMRDSLKDHGQSLQEAYGHARRVERLVPDLEIAAQRYADLARAEIERGALTGVAGAGGVADSLKSVQASIQGLITSLKADSTRVNALHTEGSAVLKVMGAVLTGDQPVMKRVALFTNHAGALSRVIADLNNRALTKVVARTMRGLAGSTGLHSISLKNARVASAQKSALARIADDLKQTGETIGLAADQLGKETAGSLPTFERIGLTTAVFKYSSSLIPFWAGGIGLDLMPVVLILLLMLLSATSGGHSYTDPVVDEMRFGDVRKVALALEGMQTVEVAPAPVPQLPYKEPGGNGGQGIDEIPQTPSVQATPKKAWNDNDEEEWQKHLNGGA